jgi:hypothetical protein
MKFFRFSFLAILLFSILPAFADSFDVFSTEVAADGHRIQVLLTPNGNPVLHGFELTEIHKFKVEFTVPSFTALPVNQVSVSLYLNSMLIQSLPFELDCDPAFLPACGWSLALTVPFFAKPVSGSVNVTINGQSETFNFRYQSILAPEPTSLSLLGTGLAAISWRKYGRKRGSARFLAAVSRVSI